jgi:hypothetical protein
MCNQIPICRPLLGNPVTSGFPVIRWEPGERTMNGLNAIVRTEREGSG